MFAEIKRAATIGGLLLLSGTESSCVAPEHDLSNLSCGSKECQMERKFYFDKIVSGGQSGVDRAALDLALRLGVAHGGWCPNGRGAEDGVIADRYNLKETPLADTAQRTEWNVRDSDGTLIVSKGQPKDGTPLTEQCAHKYGKPLFSVDLLVPVDTKQQQQFESWLKENKIKVLNIAGPRESFDPGHIYADAQRTLLALFGVGDQY